MTRVCTVACVAFTLFPLLAGAAEVTRVASSFEPDDPLGLALDVGFSRTQRRAKLIREAHQNGTVEDVNELRFTEVENTLHVDLHVGLWKDLELTIGVPYVFRLDRRFQYPAGTDDTNSTAFNNCLQANGELVDPACPISGAGAQPLYDPNTRVYRAGLGNIRFGLAYAIFNQRKDDTQPTWVVGFDYTAPTAKLLRPADPTSKESPGNIGDKVHRYSIWTALSRRMGPADPYFKLQYTLPVRGPGWYSNCDNPDPRNSAHPESCNVTGWSRSDAGIRAPHVFTTEAGTELIAHEDPSTGSRVGFDLRAIASYVSEGRYYNEMSDLFGKLMKTGEYLETGGQFSILARASEYAQLNLSARFLHRTEHLVSGERIGKDLNGVDGVEVSQNPDEIHPSFDARVDTVSRRFRATENYVFRADATLQFSF